MLSQCNPFSYNKFFALVHYIGQSMRLTIKPARTRHFHIHNAYSAALLSQQRRKHYCLWLLLSFTTGPVPIYKLEATSAMSPSLAMCFSLLIFYTGPLSRYGRDRLAVAGLQVVRTWLTTYSAVGRYAGSRRSPNLEAVLFSSARTGTKYGFRYCYRRTDI